MKGIAHKLSIFFYAAVIIATLGYISAVGISYYVLPVEERAFHDLHRLLRPTGFYGHGMGVIGSLAMLLGVALYMLRKRVRKFSRIGVLKYWLELHIFLCTLGPILVTFHTTFKFGGLVAVSFWSMVAVFASGVLGRFIYMQIPRSIQGQEFDLNELEEMSKGINAELKDKYLFDDVILAKLNLTNTINQYRESGTRSILKLLLKDRKQRKLIAKEVKANLHERNVEHKAQRHILKLIKNKFALARKIGTLRTMQKLFSYWHVAHLPFALIMLIIMIVHVGVAIAFGYTWIF